MTRNVAAFDQIIGAIREEPKFFEMELWDKTLQCGTAHCIGGWAWYFLQKSRGITEPDNATWEVQSEINAYLGLDYHEGNELFMMSSTGSDQGRELFDGVPHEERAALAIEHLELIKAGAAPNWEKFLRSKDRGDLIIYRDDYSDDEEDDEYNDRDEY